MQQRARCTVLGIGILVFALPAFTHDFDGDGKSDILWRNASSGENYLYPMDGTSILGAEGYLRMVGDPNWKIVGTGDFNGDGKSDILWRHASSGQNYIYLMNGTAILGEGYIRTVADQNWRVAGTGDFDGDGKADILWRNQATGENYLYPMDGLAIKATEGFLRTVADQSWQVAGVGDFDGDAKSDILWRNGSTGQNYLYPMDGTAIKPGEGYLRTVPVAWKIKGVADFDGDSLADIVWRNSATGENYLYPMQGTSIKATEGYFRTVADQAWQIVAVGDYDGDARSDILWRNSSTGDNYVYFMDGTTIKPSEGYIRAVADQNWHVALSSPPLAPQAANIIFVTSTTTVANRGSAAAYDTLCTLRAQAAGLPGSYVAWMSDASRNAISRLGGARGWVRPDGLPFADTPSDITAGKILYPPLVDENGVAQGGTVAVFTGTQSNGATSNFTCQNWTTTAAGSFGTGGWADSEGQFWTNATTPACSTQAHLYCLGNDRAVPVAVATAAGRLAFLSSGVISPGGLAAADSACQSEASAAGKTGTYKALLATTSASAASRFNLAGAPWVRSDGVRVVASAGHLAYTALSAPMNVTAAGTYVSGAPAWLGASDFSQAGDAASTCVNWTSASASSTATIGFADRSTDLTLGQGPFACNAARRVFCLQE